MALIPPRGSYEPHLYVERPAAPGLGNDDAVEEIASWLDRRVGGSPLYPICKVEAPPGYGKSWALTRFVDKYRADFFTPGGPQVLMLGPSVPPASLTHSWWRQQVEGFLCSKPYPIPATTFRDNPYAGFRQLVVALVEDVERHFPGAHLLVILDDLDRLDNLPEVEAALLRPLANLSRDHRVSILLALRNDFGFKEVEELKQPSRMLSIALPAFQDDQAREQIVRWLHAADPSLADPDGFANTLFGSLAHSPGYTWGVPALNTALAYAALAKSARPLTWTPSDIDACLAGALRLGSGAGPILDQARRLTHSRYPNGWTNDEAAAQLGLPSRVLPTVVKHLRTLDLIERQPGAAYNTWRLTDHWNSILDF